MKKKTMLLLFSHNLTEKQKEDAQKLGVGTFVSLPEPLQKIWSHIDPEADSIVSILDEIKSFVKIHTQKGDMVLIQGDFGATYHMVAYAKSLGLVALYATTKRNCNTYMKNDLLYKESTFEHVKFREYI